MFINYTFADFRADYPGMTSALIMAALLHIAVFMLFVLKIELNVNNDNRVVAKVIDAVIIDSGQLDIPTPKKKQASIQQDKQRQEAKRKEKLKREQQAQQEAVRIAKEKRLAEQQRLEQQRIEEERRLFEQAQLEEMRQLEEDEIAAQAQSNEMASMIAFYKQAIKQRVDRNWIRPVTAEDWYTCEVNVNQIPGGEVINVNIQKCDGDAVFQRSVLNAVYKSSPLPDPPDPSLFERRITFEFKVPAE